MNEIIIDTERVMEIGNSIVKSGNELETLINELFSLLASIREQNAWVGISSNYFFDTILKQKEALINFNKVNIQYGNLLINGALKYNALVNKYWSEK